jgi:hemoglobin-like flavoprotein
LTINEPTPKELFLQSVGRCLALEAFIPAFYDRFLSASDEIRNKFRFTDFEKQNAMLRRSLELSAGATSGDPESLREISTRAETHDRYYLNIEPRFYDIWLETIIETARDYDVRWNEGVEAAWRSILGHVVQHMVRKY